MLDFYTTLRPNLSKISELKIVLCCSKNVNLQIKRKRSSSLSLAMLLTVNIIRFMWLMCRKICLPRLLRRQTKKFGKHYLVVPLLSLLVSTLFSDWRRTLPSKFFDTQVPLVPSKNSCSLVTLTVPSLVFAATRTRPSVKLLFL